MIGVPSSYNLAFVPTDNVSGMDAEILIALEARSTARPRVQAGDPRGAAAAISRGAAFYFQPADIVSQVLNFGVSAPIDVQIEQAGSRSATPLARRAPGRIARCPGAVDVRIPQVLDHPALQIDVDRERAPQLGLTQRDVANSLLTSLTSSSLVAPRSSQPGE